MVQYIDKAAIVAEIEKLISSGKIKCQQSQENNDQVSYIAWSEHIATCGKILSFLNTLEVKEEVEYKQPEYSCTQSIYQRGEKHHWNIGDILAYYYYSSDCEGEHIIGQIVDIKIDEEQDDWVYTFENGRIYYEEELLDNGIYVKVKKK